MIASQMESARIERTTIEMETADGRTGLRATGQVVLFPGYLAVYEEGRDDPKDEDEGRLPRVEPGAQTRVIEARADQHFTEPPPRYSEASLVKRMEELGIGRPSTYASILTVLRDRSYVRMDNNRFVPEDAGRLVTAFLEQFFARYVEYDFTAALEEKLDKVSAGELDWKALLREFWTGFTAAVGDIGELRTGQVLDALNDRARAPTSSRTRAMGPIPASARFAARASCRSRRAGSAPSSAALATLSAATPGRSARPRVRTARRAATASSASIPAPATPSGSRSAASDLTWKRRRPRPSAPPCPRTGRRRRSTSTRP